MSECERGIRFSHRTAVRDVRLVVDAHVRYPAKTADAITRAFVTERAPRGLKKRVAKKAAFKMVTLAPGGIGGGRLRSARNLLLNWGAVVGVGTSVAQVVANASGPPWLLVLSVLPVAQQFFPALNRQLSERHAAVLWTLWHHGAATNRVRDVSLRRLVNKSLSEYGCSLMPAPELKRVLADLEQLRCVERNITGWQVVTDVKVKG